MGSHLIMGIADHHIDPGGRNEIQLAINGHQVDGKISLSTGNRS